LKEQIKAGDSYLLVDAGGFNGGSGILNRFKAEYVLKGLSKMGYHAINLGQKDTVHGFEFFKKMVEEMKSPIVCTNIYVANSEKRACPPFKILKVPAKVPKDGSEKNIRIGIVGLSKVYARQWKSPADTEQLDVREPIPEVIDAVKELRPRCDLVVLLAYTDWDGAREAVNEAGGIDIVIVGQPGYKYVVPSLENGVLFLPAGRQGKFCRSATVRFSRDSGVLSFEHKAKTLNESVPEDPELAAVVEAYKKRVSDWRSSRYEKIAAQSKSKKKGN
jgi:2',3'-cyclic-nucleotide 2'-phosphodiesterase (5'-nucleotidase family)